MNFNFKLKIFFKMVNDWTTFGLDMCLKDTEITF